MQVTSPMPGTYSIYEMGQRPADGVAVWFYPTIGVWACELGHIRTCWHITLAKKYKNEEPE